MYAFHKDNQLPQRFTMKRRTGFTLVELLVVISILAILVVMTVSSINLALSSDVTRSASRQVQSYLAGARDRAIYAKEPRGVRFLIDPNDPTIVTSMVYIASSPDWIQGVIRLERIDTTGNSTPDTILHVRGNGTDWRFLYLRKQLKDGARIKIPGDASGSWYTIDLNNSPISEPEPANPNSPLPNEYNWRTDEILRLSTPYRDPGTSDPDQQVAFAPGSGPSTYLLELPPVVLSGEEPTLLPNNTCIDLDRSYLPASWRITGRSFGDDGQPGVAGVNDDGSGGNDDLNEYLWAGSDDHRLYSSQLDLMFSPRGSVTGSEAGGGKIHFVIDAIENVQSTWRSTTEYYEGDHVLVPARVIPRSPQSSDFNFRPYDRVYTCTQGGTSGSISSVFLDGTARAEGTTFATDGGVTWKVELNTTPSLLSIFTRTGNISAYPLFYAGSGSVSSGGAPDVFKYAETGETAK
ncbi:Tfp pilus assembly protein FimT/FimU [Gimesia chilikensis]|uniref:Prepilin-type N-terminal cleavage/methylation domain-containing protein n=1 Tax=Gimesia chilikensis TaxID=2605989 RepID=A0A517PWS4_9PLAN|nr:prepilin-type N-terminal cleavage/methylation domain-containing protein [Gimesia chilikensis]QDT23837.1 hypothetical protein HG66A1_56620 [Gimesia chilikensis]